MARRRLGGRTDGGRRRDPSYWAEYVRHLASLARMIVGRLDEDRTKEEAELFGPKGGETGG